MIKLLHRFQTFWRDFGRYQKLTFECGSRHRPPKEIALSLFASHAHQEIGGCPILDALCDHRQAQLPGKADGRANNRRVVGTGAQFNQLLQAGVPIDRLGLTARQRCSRRSGIIAHRFDEEDPTMSPSYFAVRNAELDEKIEAARLAGDFPRVYNLLAEQTSLLRAMYGQPAG